MLAFPLQSTISPTDDRPLPPVRCVSCSAPALTYTPEGSPVCADCARRRLFAIVRLALLGLMLVPLFAVPPMALTKCATPGCNATIWPGTRYCAACRAST